MSINWTTTVNPLPGKNYTIPTYGNYGGPGFSGGKLLTQGEAADYSKPPVDALDNLFRTHDQAYGDVYSKETGRYPKQFSQEHKNALANADIAVIQGILALDANGLLSTNDSQAFAGATILGFIESNIKNTYGAGALISADEQSYKSFATQSLITGLITNPDNVLEDLVDMIGLAGWAAYNAGVGAVDIVSAIGQKAAELVEAGIATAKETINAIAEAVSNTIDDAAIGLAMVQAAVDQFIEAGIYIAKDFIEDTLNQVGDWYNDLTKWFDDATKVPPPPVRIDPIVLDLDGDGIEMIARQDNNIFFDMDGDGLKDWTGWINKDDAFLAIDENNNGLIDSVKELIGEQNTSGFTEFKNYDSNGDKIFNSNDTLWTAVKVWQDLNTNGISEANELKSLTEAGIKSIDLHYTTVNLTAADNQIHETSVFERTDGTFGTIVDVWLNVDRIAASIANTNTGNSTIDSLPDIRGFGDVASLHTAMFSDSALTTLVNTAVTFTVDQIGSLRGTAEQIIYRWADVEDVATDSRGANFDGRKLAALEKFVGHSFINTVNATNPSAQAAPFLNRAWDELLDSMQARLAIAGTLKDILPIVYDAGADRFISLYDTDQIISTLKAAQPSDTLQAAKFWGAFVPVINRIVDDAGGNSGAADHIAKVTAALAEMGLDKFQNALVNGVQSAILPASGNFSKNGVYQLSDSNETVSLNGSVAQAFFALGGNDTLTAIAPNTTAFFLLDGGNGNDVLRGSGNADWLNGGAGADTLAGSSGDDIYYVDDMGDVVRENRNEGNDTVRSTITYTLGDNVENLELLGEENLNGTGNGLANKIMGNSGVNVLVGNDGNDSLNGGGNADTLIGGLGNDTYTLDNIGDVVVEKFNGGTDTVQSNFSLVLVNSLENVVLMGTENLNGTGNSGNNSITGNVGNNVLDGKAGSDTLKGDAGDDIYWVDSTADKVVEIANGGLDTVNSSATFTLSADVENLTLLGEADINGTGNAANNILIGNTGANTLDGKAGADSMSGGASDDIYGVDNSADVVIEIDDVGIDSVNSSVSFILGDFIENLTLLTNAAINGTGNSLDNQLIGNAGINALVGNSGNDILDGKAGADSLDGGLGDDSYIVDNVGDTVTEASNAGKDTVQSSVGWVLGTATENLVLSGAAAINATGNELANRLTGNGGKNQLDGKAGADILMGLGGDDSYWVDTKDSIIENVNEGTDTVQSSFNYILGDNLENLVLLTTALNGTGNKLNNILTGNANTNTLIGNDGSDTLDGAAGADILNGGTGNDIYWVDNIADIIIEGWNGGVDKDTVQSNISYTLGKNLENLLLLGTDTLNGTGNTLNNTLTGNAGNNVLDGKGGDDTLKGGAGDDSYYVDSALDVLTEAASAGTDSVYSHITYVLGNNVENLTLLGEDDVNGTGNNVSNILIGNSGVNTLDGKTGADTLNGGMGDDIYFIDNVGDVIIENADAGVDTVNSAFSYTLSSTLENLILLGAGGLSGVGNDMDNIIIGTTGNNTLTGNAGNDFLDGGTGVDTLNGGVGDDIYVVDNANDLITEASNAGVDTVQSSVSHILLENFENLVLIGTVNIDANGNALDNFITGNSANNVLDGKGGADRLTGLAGSDTYLLDQVNDTVWEGDEKGIDVVKTTFSYVLGDNLEQLVLQGSGDLSGTGNDINNDITGNAGANILNGGNGNDTLTGGAGADIFQLTNAANIDKIIDFTVLDDTLQLDNSVFASLGAEGVLSATKLRAGTGITTAADSNDYLMYNSTDGKLYYDSDAVGSSPAVQIALLGSGLVITGADFVVI